MSDLGQGLTIGVSILALVVSCVSAAVAYLSYRAGGSRVSISAHQFEANRGEHWLRIRATNSGRSEVSIHGAWTNWLGASHTAMPIRLAAESSSVISFRGKLPPQQYFHDPLVVTIGLGNGRTLLKRIPLDERQLGQLAVLSDWEMEDLGVPGSSFADSAGNPAVSHEVSSAFDIDTDPI
jgi:hypothetical protein